MFSLELFDALVPIMPFLMALFGLILGSFANVVIYRMPKGESVVAPRSRCPHCAKMISWYDNIPVISWLILRGRCRQCQAAVSWRYPLVELLTGLIFLLIYLKHGWTVSTLEYLIFSYCLVIVSFIDFDHMILPDVFTLSGIVIGLLGAFLNPEREFLSAVWGVLAGGGFLWAVAYIYYILRKEEGMGGGDIKLLGWIGAVLGWKSIPFVILSSSLIGSVVGLALAWKTRGGMKTAIPFGPYLALGALLYILGGSTLGEWYLRLFIPGLDQ